MIKKCLEILWLMLKLVAIFINAIIAFIVHSIVFAITTSVLAPAIGGWYRGNVFTEKCVDGYIKKKTDKKD